jgi:Uma2 family endonuclease
MTTIESKGWTEKDFEAIGDVLGEKPHVENIDGLLVVTPSPSSDHQRTIKRLLTAIDAVLPPGYESLPDIDVHFTDNRVLRPDVIVVTAGVGDKVPGDKVVLVVEIASPSTAQLDRTVKADIYADEGITYWRVDATGITVAGGTRPCPIDIDDISDWRP